ncbi:MAG TPA: type III-B CRISPR module-associated Cmr3 family protein [Trichocoleus sp.]|jgi:CRISPR-associated protein Cmr3
MPWYLLTPACPALEAITSSQGYSPICHPQLMLNGHSIAAALREQLAESTIVTLHGPFLCYEETLYFFSPLSHCRNHRFVPTTWLETSANQQFNSVQQMLWDRRKPIPLMPENKLDESNNELYSCSDTTQAQQLFSSKTVLKLLKHEPLEQEDWQTVNQDNQPWSLKMRSKSAELEAGNNQNLASSKSHFTVQFNPGWRLAVSIDSVTHQKLQRFGNSCILHCGAAREPFWLELYDEPLAAQWQVLQAQSEQNRRVAAQAINQNAIASRLLAYLITPGLFERKQASVATCRAFPWEWELAEPIDQNQQRGALVSLATGDPLPISFQPFSLSEHKPLMLQVFAAPAGSVYYLEYPLELFQNQPCLRDGRSNKTHVLRQLGYSEVLWLPYCS